jgi:hypothetical protein
MPKSRHRLRSSMVAWAVIAMMGKRVNRLSQGKTSCFAHRHSCAVGAQQGRKRARFFFLSRFARDTNFDVTTFAQEIQKCIACRAPRSGRRRQIPPTAVTLSTPGAAVAASDGVAERRTRTSRLRSCSDSSNKKDTSYVIE